MASQDLSIVLRYLPEKYRKAYAEGKLSDDDLVEWGKSSGVITAPAPPKADFSDVQGHTDTVPKSRYSSLPSPVDHALTALDSVQGLGEDVANTLKGATKTFVGSKEFTAADEGNAPLAQLTQGLVDQFDLTHGGSVGGLLQNIADPKRMSLDSIAQRGGDTFKEGEQQVEAANQSAQGRVTGPTVGKIATGLASMPSALLGVAGGPSAAIPSADYYTQEYTKARLAGLDHEAARNEAAIKAGAMEAVASVPAGSIFGRIGEKALVSDLTKNALNIGSNMAGEAVKMDLITGSQLGADKWFSEYSNDQKTKDYSNANLPNDIMGVFETLKDSAYLGATMGITRAPHEIIQTAAEKGKLAANMVHGQVSSEKDLLAEHAARNPPPKPAPPTPVQGDLFGTPEGLPSLDQYTAERQKQNEIDALQSVGRKHDVVDQQQAAHVEGIRSALDQARQVVAQLQDRMDYQRPRGSRNGLDNSSQADLNALATAQRRVTMLEQEHARAMQPRVNQPDALPLQLKPVGEEQQSLPFNDPLQPGDSATLRQQLADKRARDAAEALVSEDKNVSMNKIKSEHQAARRKAIKSIVEGSRGIESHDERIAHVAEATAAWDNENSLASFINKRQAEMNKKYKDPRQQYKPPAPEAPVHATVEDSGSLTAEEPVRPDEQQKFDQMKKDLGLAQGKPPSFFASRLKELSDEHLDRLYSETLPKWVASSGSHDEGNPEKAALRAIESERFHRMREKLRAANGNSIRETIQGIKQIPNGTRVDFNHVRDGAQSGRVIGSRMLTNSHDHSKFVVHRVEYTDANGQTKQANVLPSDMTKAYVGPRGLAHEGGTGDTGVTTEHVFNALGHNLHKGDTKVAAKLIADKNLVVIDDASLIPHDAIQQGTGGYYDGKRTYVVAGELDPNNIMGGLLSIAAHEVKHGADFAASDKVKASLGHIIGTNANKRLIGKIEALAKSDSEHHAVKYDELGKDLSPEQEGLLTPAQKAVHAARQGSEGDTYDLELPAYFINAARGARDAKSGAGQLRENITAAVRNAAKRRFGDKADVNLNDMAYLSDKLLHDVAKAGDRLTIKDGQTQALPMIGGKNAKGYGEADSKDRTYMSVDGNRKFLFSDKEAALYPNHSVPLLQELGSHPDWAGQHIVLDDVLQHKELFKQYPDAREIKVEVIPDNEKYNGYYHNGTISLTKAAVDRGVGDPTGLKKLLLHEVQHWVQDKEGHANGASSSLFHTPAEKDIISSHAQTETSLNFWTKASAFSSVIQYLRDPDTARVYHKSFNDGHMTRQEYLTGLATELQINAKPGMKTEADHIATKLRSLLESKKNLGEAVDKVHDRTYKEYMRTLGEQEARFTERNHRKADEELPRNPERQTVGGPHGFDAAHASDSLIVKKGKVVGVAKETDAGKKALAMDETPLKKKGVGLAQMVYHGTPHTFDPETGHPYGKFKDAKMGTGEGAQAFGWGHYLTQDFTTADKHYRERLAKPKYNHVSNKVSIEASYLRAAHGENFTQHDINQELSTLRKEIAESDTPAKVEKQVDELISGGTGHNREEYAKYLHDKLAKEGSVEVWFPLGMTEIATSPAELRDALKRSYADYREGILALKADREARATILENTTAEQFKKELDKTKEPENAGETYHVEIPDDHVLANWDAELGDQPEAVQKAIKEIDPEAIGSSLSPKELQETFDENLDSLKPVEDILKTANRSAKSAEAREKIREVYGAYHALMKFRDAAEGVEDHRRLYSTLLNHFEDKLTGALRFMTFGISDRQMDHLREIHGDLRRGLYEVQNSQKFHEWYSEMAHEIGDKSASKALHEAGILGHYFKPPSRNAETRNFVIYDENSLKVTGRDAREKGLSRREIQPDKYESHSDKLRRKFEEDARAGTPMKGLPFNAKQFAEAKKNFTNPDNKAIRLLKSMFSYSGNLGKELNEMREDSTGEAALYSHRGMNAFARINTAISHMADMGVKRGVYKTHAEGMEAFKKQVNAKLETIAKLEDPARREAALSAYVRDNPGMRPVMDAVNEINQLSRTLLIQLVKTHPDPTPEQLRLMTTIHENSFRYATRMFAAFQGDAGRAHSTKLIKEYEKGQKALASGQIPEKFKESYRVVNDAVKFLIDNDLSIPDREGLEAANTDKLNNLFTTWVGNADETRQRVRAQARANGATHAQADQMVRETLISALDDRNQSVRKEDLEGKSMDIIKGMLDLNPSDSPFATFYRGFAQDRSILEHRERLPQEIKDLFGEIKDPATRLAVTIAKQGELAARTRLLLDMRDHGEGKWVIKGTDAGLPGNEHFTVPLKGETYGPLKDYRTTPAIADAIGKNLEMYSTLTQAVAKSYTNTQAAVDALARVSVRGLTRAAGTQKLMSVVFDLYNIGQNFIGSPLGLLANGVVNPKYYMAGLKTGGEVIMDTAFDNQNKLSADYQDAIRFGVLDSARVQEIRATPQRTIRNMITDETKAVRQGKSLARRGARTVVETFAMSDAWIKVSAFKERTDMLTKFYKAEGISKTEEQIKREAADTIKDTTISYSRVPPAIKTLEAVGATTFLPYFYSVPRSISHNYIRGVKDLILASHAKTAEGSIMMAMSGAQRITGATAATYGFAVLLKSAAAAINGPDKDKADEMKKLMSEDARFSDSVYVGRDKTDTPLFARFSRIDPFGPSTDIMRVYMNDKLTPEEKNRFAMKLFGNLFFSNRITQAVVREGASFAGVDIKDKKTKIERFAPAAAEKVKDFLTNVGHMSLNSANASMELVDSFVPGIMDAFDPTNAHPTSVKNNDPAFRFLSDMILASGGRLDRADPGLAAYAAGQEVKRARDDGRKRMKDGFAANSSPEDLMDRFKTAATAEYLALRHASTVYEGMTNGLGYTPRQASQVLKDDASLTPVDINAVRTGRISSEADSWVNQHSQILSKQSLIQRSQTDEKRMTKDEAKQNRKNINEFLKQMQALGLKVNNSTKKD